MASLSNQFTNVSPEAATLASRIDALHANGHGWMDPILQTHLATSGGSQQQMLDTAATYKNVVDNTGTGTTHAVADGKYNQPPSKLQQAASYLHNVHGPVPILQSDVTEIQKNLQNKGYGVGLQPGTWNPQWAQALNKHAQDTFKAPGIGNVKSLPFWKGVLKEIAPSTWTPTILHAVGNYMHTLPEQGRQLLTDLAVESGNYLDPKNLVDMFNPAISKTEQAAFKAREASRVSKIEGMLGGTVAPEDVNMTGRAAVDLSNVLNLLLLKGVGKAGFSAVSAIGKATAAELATKETVSEAAKALVTRSLPEDWAAAPRFTVVKSLYQAGAEGEKGIGALRWMENIPVLKRMLPAIDALDAEGSKYFAFKQAMAQSMRIPARQLTATLQAKGALAGLGLLGSSELAKGAGGTPMYDASGVQAYGGVLGNALDVAGMFAGSPTRGLQASKNVGQVVDEAHGALHNALGSIGIDVPLRQGLGISLKELQDNLGPEFVNDHFVNTKLNQYAASHYAEKMLGADLRAGKFDANSQDAQKAFMDYEHEALNEPDILAPERESLINQPAILGNYYRKDFANQLGLNLRRGKSGQQDKERFFEAMNKFKQVHEPMATILDPAHRNLFFGSATQVKVEDAITKGLAEDWGKKIPGFDQIIPGTNNPSYLHVNPLVNEFAPDASKLTRTTPYGAGVVTTENTGIAGRANASIYALTHQPVDTELPRFYDMVKKGNNSIINSAVQGWLKSNRIESTPEIENLRKIMGNKFNFSAQDTITAFRKALAATGNMNKDQIDATVNQITQSVMEEKGYTGFHFWDNKYGRQTVINPDRAKAVMVKQDPKWSKESLIPSYLTHNNIVGRGALGVARKDTFVAQDAQGAARNLFDKMAALGHAAAVDAARSTLQLEEQQGLKDVPLPNFKDGFLGKAETAIAKEARNILIAKLGYSPNEVTRFDPIQAISEIWRSSKSLASEAHIPLEAPQAIKDAVAKLDSLGYRPVLGTDIGHAFESPILHPAIVEQSTKMRRRAAMRFGIDTTKIGDLPVAQVRRTMVESEVNKLFANGKVQPILGDNGSSIYSTLLQGAQSGAFSIEGRLSGMFRGAIEGLRGGPEGSFTEQQLGDLSKVAYEDIQAAKEDAKLKSMQLFNQAHGIRDLSLKQMVKILTRPVDVKDPLGNLNPRYTREDAMKIAKAVLIGYAKTPSSIVGAGKVEDFIRASNAMMTNATASFFGQVPLLKNFKIGEGTLANNFASLPNDLARLRDRWRFDYSPIFALRRLTKTNVKAATEGVPTTMNPYAALKRLGKVDQAFATLQRTMPEVYRVQKDLEPLEKFLQQSDIFNIYNPAHMMAWQAHNLEQLGLSDAEITAKLTKINTYGERTPLERTVNTVFYPFSFNKTLYRNIGGWLLDHAGEAMLIGVGFDLYHKMNLDDPNDGLGAWVTKHAPLLDELKKLNAFEHGTGLGQAGGINAPYIDAFMNIFSPQSITPMDGAKALKTWMTAVPALQELNTLLFNYQASTGTAEPLKAAIPETAKTGYWAARNLWQHVGDLVTGHQSKMHTTLTDQAQVQAGIEAVTQLKVQLADVIGSGAVWPDVAGFPKGEVINAASIGRFVQSIYPAYDPSLGTALALKRNQEAKNYVASLDGTFRYEAYDAFRITADKMVRRLNKTSDPETIRSAVAPLREIAVNLAEQDSKFVAFYNRYYQNAFGPIEGLTK